MMRSVHCPLWRSHSTKLVSSILLTILTSSHPPSSFRARWQPSTLTWVEGDWGNNLPSKEFKEDLFVWCYFLHVELANHLGCCEWTKFVQHFLAWIQYPWRRVTWWQAVTPAPVPMSHPPSRRLPINPSAWPSQWPVQADMLISPSFPPPLPCPLNSKHG